MAKVHKIKASDNKTKNEIFPAFFPILNCKPYNTKAFTSNLEVSSDFELNHEYINKMVEKFSLNYNQCNTCHDLSKVFLNPEYYYNELYVKNSKWILNKNSVLSVDIEPYNSLKIPIFDIRNINLKYPAQRPHGKIHIVRESSNIKQKHSFVTTARISSMSALQKSRGKPHMSKEIAYKISEDINKGVLKQMFEIKK